jgi:CheY-like chemotaxis protein
METRKLLLVDDVALFLQLEKTFLTRSSFKIDTATNGNEALKRARLDKPDLIVLDLHMPDMDGDVVCRLLKGDPDTSPIPIIMVSSAQKEEDRQRCLDAGCQAYLTKPIKKEELSSTVEEQLNVAVRSYARVDVIWSCVVRIGDIETTGLIRNISEGGAFLSFDEIAYTGRTARLRFQIPGNDGRSNVSAKICWAGRIEQNGPEGFGVSFQLVSASDLAAIREYINAVRSRSCSSSGELERSAESMEAVPEGNL